MRATCVLIGALLALTGVRPATELSPSVVNAAVGQIQSGAAKSVSVAVVLDGNILAPQTFGGAGSGMAFSVGSVSKMFTAVSVLQLVQAGKILLDGDVATYLPHYPALRGITVRELLDHTSGLPNYVDDAINSGAAMRATTPHSIITSMLSRPRDFSPGSDWNYSNTGYVVLGQIVESISGLPLATYEYQRIFKVAALQRRTRNTAKSSAARMPGNAGLCGVLNA